MQPNDEFDNEFHIIMYVDGSASYSVENLPKRGPNAKLCCAYQIEHKGHILRKEFIEIDFLGTNNQAEFLAAIHGINGAKEIGATHIIMYSDSSLVVNAINGTNKRQSSVVGSKEWTMQIRDSIERDFMQVTVEWIPRRSNAVDHYLSDCLGLKRSPKKKAERLLGK